MWDETISETERRAPARLALTHFGLIHDVSHYFDVHHTEADTLDKVDPQELQQGVAAMAVLAYALAELDAPL